MNIIKFTASNIKRIRAVAIEPTGALVRITGANGSGKSSTLDGLYYLLAGTSNIPTNPIRDGQDTAEVSANLGEGGVLKYKVTRKFQRGKTSQVVVESVDGARFGSPQALLDRLFGSLTFDPEVFGRMSPKEQLNQLKALVKLDVDLDALDAANKADYDARTEANRRVKQLKEQVDTYAGGLAPDMDVSPISVGSILAEMEAASAHNSAIDREELRRKTVVDAIRFGRSEAYKKRVDAERLLKEAGQMEAEATRLEDELKTETDLPTRVDVGDLSRAVQDATRANTERQLQRDQRAKHQAAKAALDAASAVANEYTARIERRDTEKRQAIASAKMPVDGLGFGDNEVTFNGLPFNQIASGDQLVIQCEIAAALSPELKIIRIRNGSLIDSANMARLGAWAESRGYQIFIEEVDETGTVGIYLEDGEVVAVDGVPVEQGAS